MAVQMHERFQERVLQTLSSLRSLEMSDEWNITLQVWDDEYLLSYFNTYTAEPLKHLLDTHSPPTFEDLKTLDWLDTTDAGVYARLIWPTMEKSTPHIYVGSATSTMGGLSKRKLDHEYRPIAQQCAYYKTLMNQPGVPRTSKFVTIYTMDWGLCSIDDINLNRKLCLLAEAVFTAMLGGYMPVVDKPLQLACPYGDPKTVFDWRGTCTHSSLSESQRLLHIHKKAKNSASSKLPWFKVRSGARRRKDLTPEELQACREKDKLAMREYRKKFRHLLKARKANRTPQEIIEHKEKKKLYQRRYRKEHAMEIKAREALLPPEVKKERAERSKLRTQKSRLKKRLANPKPPRIIPPHRVKRNADRKRLRDGDVDFKKISMHGTRVKRARDALNKLKVDGVGGKELDEAKKKFAIAFVDRYNLMVSLGRPVREKPSQEQFDLAGPSVQPNNSKSAVVSTGDEVDECSEEEDIDTSEDETSDSEDELDTDDEELFIIPHGPNKEGSIPKNESTVPRDARIDNHLAPAPEMVSPWTIAAKTTVKKQEKSKPFLRMANGPALSHEMTTPWTIATDAFRRQQTILGRSLVRNESPSRKRVKR
ncbi:hypothetical protein DTO021C3_8829 [Paecilomyces variotii]|nr:hypothetical protein DTO021C3_8829 [Paecilomyces variotii]